MGRYTVSDVSKIFDVGEETVRRWIRDGKLNAERGLGRSGSTIYLDDIIDFANSQPGIYLAPLSRWLDKNGIQYKQWSERITNSPVLGLVPSIGLGAGLGSIVGGPIGTILGTATAVAGTALESRSSHERSQIRLSKLQEEKIDVAETSGIEPSAESSLELKPSVTTTPIDKQKSTNSTREVEINGLIKSEQMKLFKLRQELAQISAQISICENQIEYLKLLLEE